MASSWLDSYGCIKKCCNPLDADKQLEMPDMGEDGRWTETIFSSIAWRTAMEAHAGQVPKKSENVTDKTDPQDSPHIQTLVQFDFMQHNPESIDSR